MARYKALRDTLLSHECRVVKSGEAFTTTFPDVGGKPMRLGDNLELLEDEDGGEEAAGKSKKAKA